MENNFYSLWAMPKHSRGSASSLSPITVGNWRDVCAWWDGSLDESQCAGLKVLFQSLHGGALWLACSCNRNKRNPPLIGTVEKNGSFSLRRLTDRASHLQDCVFYSEQNIRTKPDKLATLEIDNLIVQPDFLKAETPVKVRQRTTPVPTSAGATGEGVVDSFARQLFWLLDNAGVNRYPRYDGSKKLVLGQAQQIALTPVVKLADVLFCDARAWHGKWLHAAFKRSDRAGLGKRAILVCPVDDASSTERWVKMSGYAVKTPINGRTAIYGAANGPASFPMLMYAKARLTDDGVTILERAYLHPIYSTHDWCPVDSNNERKALAVMLQCCLELKEAGKAVAIEKPLANWNGTGTRPDFVLTSVKPEKTLIVETMGFSDAEYVARKTDMAKALKAFKIYKDNRAPERPVTDPLLKEAVLRFFN